MIENSLTDKIIVGGTDLGTLRKLREPRKLLAEIEKLNAALAERDKELAAATRIVENQESQIMRLAKEKDAAEARVKELEIYK